MFSGGERSNLKRLLKANIAIDKQTNCWVWQGWINAEGYGRIQIKKKKYLAHRISAVAFKGYNLEDYDSGLQVNHLCHNRACINPDHFYIGTQEDNMDDLDTKLSGTSLLRRMVLAVYLDSLTDNGEIQLTYNIYNAEDPVPALDFPSGAEILGEFDIEIPPVKE